MSESIPSGAGSEQEREVNEEMITLAAKFPVEFGKLSSHEQMLVAESRVAKTYRTEEHEDAFTKFAFFIAAIRESERSVSPEDDSPEQLESDWNRLQAELNRQGLLQPKDKGE